MTISRTSRLALLVAGLLAVLAVSALAHYESGGGGNDTLQGHDHPDWLEGNSGCDELLGRGSGDYLFGGPSGCDKARGMEGSADAAVVWDDNVGNDEAYGGSGSADQCYVGNQDYYDVATCEVVSFP